MNSSKDVREYIALTPADEAMKIIKRCFLSEKKGDKKARAKASSNLKSFLTKTDDGSYTLNSNNFNQKSETMHTRHGAITESIQKFVKPAKLEAKKKAKILDICSGLGYNAASCIQLMDENAEIKIDMVEISKETIAATLLIENPIESYEVIKGAVEERLFEEGYIEFKFHKEKIPSRINISIYIDDARNVVKKLESKRYDAIFLDPFSPAKSPELYTLEFICKLKNLLKDDGIILTYTSAAPVRSAMVHSGLHVGEGPTFGRKSGGTMASIIQDPIEKPLSKDDERMIALSDAGIPFKDRKLDASSNEIIERRQRERKSVRGVQKFASTVKTPIYLCRDIQDSRIKRRVLKNLEEMGINDLDSKEAAFIVCPQFENCICTCGNGKIDNSKDRIKELAKRLSIITEEL